MKETFYRDLFNAHMEIMCVLDDFDCGDALFVISSVIGFICADFSGMHPDETIKMNRKNALKFYDNDFRKMVISAFDIVDGMNALRLKQESEVATKQ